MGFRQPGLRLASPSSAQRDGLTLTVRDLVCAPEGTDLTYDISDGSHGGACIIPGKGQNAFDAGWIVFLVGDQQHGGPRWLSPAACGMSAPEALPIATDHVGLRVTGGCYGDWSVPLDLVAFTAEEGAMRSLDATATHEGTTIHVRGISTTEAATAHANEGTGPKQDL